MANDVNVNLTNFRTTGANVSFPQRAIDVTITWKDDAGRSHSDTRTVQFPNILTNVALPAGWLQNKLIDLCYQSIRIIIGIDDGSN